MLSLLHGYLAIIAALAFLSGMVLRSLYFAYQGSGVRGFAVHLVSLAFLLLT